MGSHLLKTGTAALHVREALPSSFTSIRKDVLAEKHLLFSEAHPSHFHKKQKEAAPAVPASYFFPYSKEIPVIILQGNFRDVFPEGLPADTPNGPPKDYLFLLLFRLLFLQRVDLYLAAVVGGSPANPGFARV